MKMCTAPRVINVILNAQNMRCQWLTGLPFPPDWITPQPISTQIDITLNPDIICSEYQYEGKAMSYSKLSFLRSAGVLICLTSIHHLISSARTSPPIIICSIPLILGAYISTQSPPPSFELGWSDSHSCNPNWREPTRFAARTHEGSSGRAFG